MNKPALFSEQACPVQHTSLACSLHYPLTKSVFTLFHSSCHFIKKTQTISRLRMTEPSLTPVSAIDLYPFTERENAE